MREWCDDIPDVSLHVTRRVKAARKEHRCDACRDPIRVGEPYERAVYVTDGEFGVFRSHPVCPSMRADLERQMAEDEAWFAGHPEVRRVT